MRGHEGCTHSPVVDSQVYRAGCKQDSYHILTLH